MGKYGPTWLKVAMNPYKSTVSSTCYPFHPSIKKVYLCMYACRHVCMHVCMYVVDILIILILFGLNGQGLAIGDGAASTVLWRALFVRLGQIWHRIWRCQLLKLRDLQPYGARSISYAVVAQCTWRIWLQLRKRKYLLVTATCQTWTRFTAFICFLLTFWWIHYCNASILGMDFTWPSSFITMAQAISFWSPNSRRDGMWPRGLAPASLAESYKTNWGLRQRSAILTLGMVNWSTVPWGIKGECQGWGADESNGLRGAVLSRVLRTDLARSRKLDNSFVPVVF